MKVTILDDYQDAVRQLDCFAALRGHEVSVYHDTVKDLDTLAGRLQPAEAVVLIRERTTITAELLERLPNLRLISQTGKGTTHIDLEAARRRGVVVCAGTGSPYAPAELTFGLILASMRRIPQESDALRQGKWQTGLGRSLRGRVLGIWGYGKIGTLVAKYAEALGMKVVAFGREGSLQRAAADGRETVSRRELFERSDVVSVHLRLTPETHGIVRGDDLALMKKDALFVNTSRAELVEEGALLRALDAGRPGFAAVDVYDDEPATSSPLLGRDEVLCTPHLGYVERDSYELYFGQAFEQVNAFAAGKPINVV